MARKYIDCREYPPSEGQKPCTVALSADSDDELLEAAMQHATRIHGYQDTPEVRDEMKSHFKEGAPRV